MALSEFDKNAEEVLIRCGRHCCICRRFRPTQLQVHHIIERSDGGTDEFDNLIAACITCHSDVHTKRPFARRFSVDEQKAHRDRVYEMVASGKLIPLNDDSVSDAPQCVVESADDNEPFTITRGEGLVDPRLMKESIATLMAAARSRDGLVLKTLTTDGFAVSTGGQNLVPSSSPRDEARYKRVIEELLEHGLLSGFEETFHVTHRGYLLADELEAAGFSPEN